MIKLKSIIASVAIALLGAFPALAQSGGQLGPGQMWGNPNTQPGRGVPASVSAMIDQSVGATRGSVLYRGAAGWAIRTPGTAGLPLVSAGAGADPAYSLVGANALPAPTASTLGGVQSLTCSSHNWFSTLSTAGVFGCSQPSFADLTSSLACTQAPALTGDVTTTAGSCATTIAAGAVSNSKLANMGAWTIKLNNTSGSAAPTDTTIDGLTLKASPAASDEIPLWDASGTAMKKTTVAAIAAAGSVGSVNGLTGAVLVGMPVSGGRLTPSSGVCNPTADIPAATAIYLAPCNGRYVQIYNGTNVAAYDFTSGPTDVVGLTLTLGSNWAANTLYDVFVTLNGGVPTLCTVAWSTSGAGTSTRATALGQYNFQTNATLATCRISNAATISMAANQGTYVGTFLTNGSTGQIDLKFGSDAAGGGAALACCWNAYNQILGSFVVRDTTSQWNPTATGFQAMDAGGTGSGLNNRVTFVQGAQVNIIDAGLTVSSTPITGFNNFAGIGLNTSGGFWGKCGNTTVGPNGSGSNGTWPMTSICAGYAPVGLNYLQAVQNAGSTSAIFYGGSSVNEGLVVKWLW